jgi:hypothetical protein
MFRLLLSGSCPLWTAAPFQLPILAPVVLFIIPRYGPRRHHPFSCASRFRGNEFTQPFPRSGRLFLLRICCLGTDVVPLSVSLSLPRNECCFRAVRKQRFFSGSTILALSKYATLIMMMMMMMMMITVRRSQSTWPSCFQRASVCSCICIQGNYKAVVSSATHTYTHWSPLMQITLSCIQCPDGRHVPARLSVNHAHHTGLHPLPQPTCRVCGIRNWNI